MCDAECDNGKKKKKNQKKKISLLMMQQRQRTTLGKGTQTTKQQPPTNTRVQKKSHVDSPFLLFFWVPRARRTSRKSFFHVRVATTEEPPTFLSVYMWGIHVSLRF
jgi:hypothetical protein